MDLSRSYKVGIYGYIDSNYGHRYKDKLWMYIMILKKIILWFGNSMHNGPLNSLNVCILHQKWT